MAAPARRVSARLSAIAPSATLAVDARAKELKAAGRPVIGFGAGEPDFPTPDYIVEAAVAAAKDPKNHRYSPAAGLPELREAIAAKTLRDSGVSLEAAQVLVTNGGKQAVYNAFAALLDPQDEVLVPAPYWTTYPEAIRLAGGVPVEVFAGPEQGYKVTVDQLDEAVTDRTKVLLFVSPSNPTGAVYSREVLEGIANIAREHELMVLADEIYDRVLYDGASHTSMAEIAPDLICITFNGLSKAYRVCGYRAGWMVLTGPKHHARGFIEGLELLAGTRLCPNVPAQHAIQVALGGRQSIYELTGTGGRLLRQRNIAYEKLNEIPGVSAVKPMGSLYLFPRLDPNVYEIHDDAKLMLDILKAEKILMVQGTGFNWPNPDHFRVVTLPWASQIENAIERLGNFLVSYKQ